MRANPASDAVTGTHAQGPWRWLLCYGVWILLSVVAGVVAWYLHTLILYLTALVIENPAWRPLGWSLDSLVGVSKLSVLVVGSLWLLVTMWLEGALRRSLLDRRFWRFAGRATAALVLVWLLCYGALAI